MKDKELDQMLKKALTQDIRDDETKIKFEMGDYSMKKRKTYIKPAVALVACAALVVGVAYGDVPGKIMNNNTVSTNSGTSAPGEKESVVNSFAVKVKAAEVQKLEKGKEIPVISEKDSDGAVWGGDEKTKEIDYLISCPIIIEGDQIDTITYSVNHGGFRVVEPEKNSYVLSGDKYDDDEGKIGDFEVKSKVKMVKNFYSTFTIAAKSQQKAVIYLYDYKKVTKNVFEKMWNTDSDDNVYLEKLVEGRNAAFDNLTVTCKITYKDGTSENVDIAVKEKIMTYKEAYHGKGDKKIKMLSDEKSYFTTFELK